MNLKDYKRIIIIGSPGSGKSWLAREIAEKTDYPLFLWIKNCEEKKVTLRGESK